VATSLNMYGDARPSSNNLRGKEENLVINFLCWRVQRRFERHGSGCLLTPITALQRSNPL